MLPGCIHDMSLIKIKPLSVPQMGGPNLRKKRRRIGGDVWLEKHYTSLMMCDGLKK